jgi:mitochondrial fission protein ELM1
MTIWILTGGRKGDLDQMLVLARATGWPFEVKQAARKLSPPWPDLVFCAEAAASRVALAVKRKSSGRTKAICIGRPAGAARHFDLVITTAQYRIPRAPNVVEISMPLAEMAEVPAASTAEGPVALLVGGPAFPDRFDAATATRIASDAMAYASSRRKTLSVLTSPRTPRIAAEALRAAITPPHQISIFGEGENRYRAVLAEASEIVVTSDSVSMLSDALATGKPVSVYPLPQELNLKWQAGEWLHRQSQSTSLLSAPIRWLFDAGIVEAAADRRQLHARLMEEKRIVAFGEEPLPPPPGAQHRDLATALQSLRALMPAPK